MVEGRTFITAPACFFTSEKVDLKYLLAVLCSSYAKYFIYNNSDTTGAGDIMLNIQSLEKLPIPTFSSEKQVVFCEKVSQILNSKQYNKETSSIEKELNKMICDIFEFDLEEVQFIENQ